MAIRSLTDVWVDANFKETQLGDLRIGQPVDLYLDMYGDRHAFKGRIEGFTMGTGSTLALLPAQNATGNFVKVVSGCRFGSRSRTTIPTNSRCSSAPRLFLTSSSTSLPPGPTPGSFSNPTCLRRRFRVRLRARRAPRSD